MSRLPGKYDWLGNRLTKQSGHTERDQRFRAKGGLLIIGIGILIFYAVKWVFGVVSKLIDVLIFWQ